MRAALPCRQTPGPSRQTPGPSRQRSERSCWPDRSSLHSALALALTLLTTAVRAQEVGESVDDEALAELAELSIEQLLSTKVEVSTGTQLSLARTPAVVIVITARDLAECGCRSLAEALRLVPGFYDVDNLVTHNFGVRGINGGVGAAGSIIKVMIDGQSVAYLPTSGNFFDRELIPIDAVERIEVLRGPASALYGANAFLGVINVIAKRGYEQPGIQTTLGIGTIRNQLGAEASIVAAAGEPGVADVLIAVSGARLNRSGLTLPESSPLLDTGLSSVSNVRSRGDESRPRAIFARASAGDAATWGEISALVSNQRLDSHAEFDELAPLTHASRVVRDNQVARLSYTKALSAPLRLTASGAYLASSADGDTLSLGDDSYVLKRVEEARAVELAANAVFNVHALEVKLGVDHRQERHLPVSFDEELRSDVIAPDGTRLRRAGTRTPTANPKRRRLDNAGMYAQLYYPFLDAFSATLGLRFDYHSLYGTVPSPRAVVVYAPPERGFYAKLGYGASFRAPSAEQLYGEAPPRFSGSESERGRIGSVAYFDRSAFSGQRVLRPQRAHTVEGAGGVSLGKQVALTGSAYFTEIDDRVQYEPSGFFFVSRNIGTERLAGTELTASVVWGARIKAWLSGSYVRAISLISNDDSTLTLRRRPGTAFPPWSAHSRVTYRIPLLELSVSPELTFVGPRPAAQGNADLVGRAYSLGAYVLLGAALFGEWELWSGHPTKITARIENLLNQRYADPGFYGFDVPALGTRAFVYLSQQF